MTDSMIQLSNRAVNGDHIEEAYLQESSTISSCGHYLKVGEVHYNCTTKIGVVVYYASGRIKVYGGDDANTLWVALHGVPAYVDTEDCLILQDGHGLKVKIRSGNEIWPHHYDWVQAPEQLDHDQLAEALLRLLWVQNYVDTDKIAGLDEGTHKAVFVHDGVGIVAQGVPFRDAVLLMPCSYTTRD